MLCGWGDGFWGIRVWAIRHCLSLGRAADGWALPTALIDQAIRESAPNSALSGLKQAELICRDRLDRFGLS